jgi:hypothetical protein
MSLVEINGREYKLEDLDFNGNPYKDVLEASPSRKPDYWPFLPTKGEKIVIRHGSMGPYLETVHKVLPESNRIHTTHQSHKCWMFVKERWDDGHTFEKYTGQPGLTER